MKFEKYVRGTIAAKDKTVPIFVDDNHFVQAVGEQYQAAFRKIKRTYQHDKVVNSMDLFDLSKPVDSIDEAMESLFVDICDCSICTENDVPRYINLDNGEKLDMGKCIHTDHFRRYPLEMGGCGECPKLKRLLSANKRQTA